MGKHEPMTAKAIANKIKAKGLQKIKYYCEMCKKQCRDDNGFKCHIQSEAHQRQALVVAENPEQFVNEFSKQFQEGFMYILRTRYRSKRVLANTVFQEYIKDREHVHLNGTRWTSLTEFAYDLGKNGLVKVDESDRGVMVTYIDNDPETLRRQELEAKRAAQAKEAAIKEQREIERQMKTTQELYKKLEREKPAAEPVPIVRVAVGESVEPVAYSTKELEADHAAGAGPSTSCDEQSEEIKTIERPMFGLGAISLKAASSSNYKPPPPKRKVLKKVEAKKRPKIG